MAVSSSEEPTFIEALEDFLDTRLLNVHVCLPGQIKAYDNANQTATVQVCLRRQVADETGASTYETFPVLYDVPVEGGQTANFFQSFPVGAGDFVWLHFVEQSINNWLDKGGADVKDPIKRRFDLRDCFAILARNPAAPIAESETDSLVIGGRGSRPRAYFKDDVIALGEKSPAEFVALAQKTLTEMNKIMTYLSAIDGVIQGGGTLPVEPGNGAPSALNAALKIAVTTAGGLPTLSSPAATKVKAV